MARSPTTVDDARAEVRRLLDDPAVGAGTPALGLLDFDAVLRVPDRALAEHLTRLYASLVLPDPPATTPHQLTLTAVAAGYEVHLDATRLLATPAKSIAFQALVWHANRQAIDHSTGSVLVHASAAARAGTALVMPGPMGAGKSTLVAALVRAGLDYLTDEVVAIDPGSGLVRPYPKYLSLDGDPSGAAPADVRDFLGDSTLLAPDALRPGAAAREPARPRFVVTPRYEPGATATLAPLRPAAALAALAQHSFHLETDPARTLDVLAAVVEESACFELVSGDVPGATRLLLGLVGAEDRVRA
jgi:hypothetical protein